MQLPRNGLATRLATASLRTGRQGERLVKQFVQLRPFDRVRARCKAGWPFVTHGYKERNSAE
ncbi:hypothetical protein GCM10022213_21310 [Parerythrobacter jejuensis]